MIEINLLKQFAREKYRETAAYMEEALSAIGYSVVNTAKKGGIEFTAMQKKSEFFRMKSVAVAALEENEVNFYCAILDDEGDAVSCDEFGSGEESPRSWKVPNPRFRDIGLFCFGIAESYISGETNIQPILQKCRQLKIPGAKMPSRGAKRKNKGQKLEEIAVQEEAEALPEKEKPLEEIACCESGSEGLGQERQHEHSEEKNKEYRLEFVYVAPKPIEAPAERKFALLYKRQIKYRNPGLSREIKRPAVSKADESAFEAWWHAHEVKHSYERRIYEPVFFGAEKPRELPPGEQKLYEKAAADEKKAASEMLSQLGLGFSRMCDVIDIIHHKRLRGMYKNTVRKVEEAAA